MTAAISDDELPGMWEVADFTGGLDEERPAATAPTGKRLTTPAVMEATGATYRQLDYWCKVGYLRPDNEGAGCGSARSWPPSEVRIAALMMRLLSLGFHLEQAAALARDDGERRRVTDRLADIEDGLS